MHPAMPVMLAALAFSRGAAMVGVMFVVLLAHEGAHALCARAVGVQVEQIELMPFGGAVRLAGFQALQGWRGALIAAAGPLANLLMIMACATLVQYQMCAPQSLRLFVSCNAALMLLNLLPVLPMDGGRIVCAVLACVWNDASCRRILSVLGGCVSILLMLTGAVDAWRNGRINMTVFLMGSYLLYAAVSEYRVPSYRQIENTLGKQSRVLRQEALAVREVMAHQDMPVYRLAARLNTGAMHRIRIADDQAQTIGVLDEADIIHAMMQNPTQRLRDILAQQKIS